MSWLTIAGLLFLAIGQVLATCNTPSVRYLNATCNNLQFPSRGVAGDWFAHFSEGYEFSDGISLMVTNRPNERVVSNSILAFSGGSVNANGLSLFSTFFGQFVSHDFGQTDRPSGNRSDILLPPNDPLLFIEDANHTVKCCTAPTLNTRRSAGAIVDGIFRVTNKVSHYLDANQIYGPNEDINNRVRSHVGGKLITASYDIDISEFSGGAPGTTVVHLDNIQPTVAMIGTPKDPANLVEPDDQVFAAGDPRVSENGIIGVIHILFTREHNRLADIFAAKNPSWTDEQIFQKTRTYVIAELQNIIYEEFLPSVFGKRNVKKLVGRYQGYDSTVDARTSDLFSTAAFRYGHSTIPNTIPLLNECGDTDFTAGLGGLLLFGGQNGGPFFPTKILGLARSIENLVRSSFYTTVEELDALIVDNMRSINFNIHFGTGVDVASANMRRGRLHGLPNYHAIRKIYYSDNPAANSIYGAGTCTATETSPSPDPIGCFSAITDNCTLAVSLQQVYGKINRIDPWIGILAEKHAPGSVVGWTPTRIILDQFKRARDGDRFWWSQLDRSFLSNREKNEIAKTRMSDIIRRTTGVGYVPENVFLATPMGNPECNLDEE